jgi:formylglycine-generating enzyme required for sulfatase activity
MDKNSLGMTLVLIPAGAFMMGSPDSGIDAEENERPLHKVRITKPFWLGKYEVTVGQFRKFIEESDYRRSEWRNAFDGQTDEHPVVNVSWDDAVAFCQWLSKREDKSYRLPTEAEWEYACRAGTTTRWSFGDNEGDLGEYAWYEDNSAEKTHPVGQKQTNAWGLYDMHGNVWEWCADWYAKDYHSKSPTNDPAGPSSRTHRVLRGGSWDDCAWNCRSARRFDLLSDSRIPYIGFRVARTLYPFVL